MRIAVLTDSNHKLLMKVLEMDAAGSLRDHLAAANKKKKQKTTKKPKKELVKAPMKNFITVHGLHALCILPANYIEQLLTQLIEKRAFAYDLLERAKSANLEAHITYEVLEIVHYLHLDLENNFDQKSLERGIELPRSFFPQEPKTWEDLKLVCPKRCNKLFVNDMRSRVKEMGFRNCIPKTRLRGDKRTLKNHKKRLVHL